MTDQRLFCEAHLDLKETKNDQDKGTNRKKVSASFFTFIQI